jgi:G3E family GTPase
MGAGKTTLLNYLLLNHLLRNREDKRVAVIVNDMSEVNIDGVRWPGSHGHSRLEEFQSI